jgi:hypothetical protein
MPSSKSAIDSSSGCSPSSRLSTISPKRWIARSKLDEEAGASALGAPVELGFESDPVFEPDGIGSNLRVATRMAQT